MPDTKVVELAKMNHLDWRKLIYESALMYADMGYEIFPIQRGEKRAISKDLTIRHATREIHQIREWFDPDTGSHAGCNIAIGINGFAVVDVEAHKGGNELMSEWSESAGNELMPTTMVQQTANGGLHILAAPTPDLGKKTTTKNQEIEVFNYDYDEDGCSLHIVAAPSIVINKEGDWAQYQWLTGMVPREEITIGANLPSWFISKMLGQDPSSATQVRTLPTLAARAPENAIGSSKAVITNDAEDIPIPTIDVIKEAVDHIDVVSANYEKWLEVGMSLADTYKGTDYDDQALAVWEEWSAKDKVRYVEGECKRKWDGFSSDNRSSITIGTLFHYIKQDDPNYRIPTQFESLSIIKQIQNESPMVMIGGQIRFAHHKGGNNWSMMGKETAMDWWRNKPVMLNGKPHNPVNIYLNMKDRLEYNGIVFAPPGFPDPIGDRLNMWKGWQIEGVEGDISPFMELMEHLIPIRKQREWVLQWMAQMFQNPGAPPSTAVILNGREGIGKNTITYTLERILYYSGTFWQTHSEESIFNKFNRWRLGKLLVVLNEALFAKNHKHIAAAKGLITDKVQPLELKGVDSVDVRFCDRFMFTTNEDHAIAANVDTRRYMMPDLGNTLKGKTDWFKGYYNWVNYKRSQEKMFHYFTHLPITRDINTTMATDTLNKQKAETMLAWDKETAEFMYVLAEIADDGRAYNRIIDGIDRWFIPNPMIWAKLKEMTGGKITNRYRTMMRFARIIANDPVLSDYLVKPPPKRKIKIGGATFKGWIVTAKPEELHEYVMIRLGERPSQYGCDSSYWMPADDQAEFLVKADEDEM